MQNEFTVVKTYLDVQASVVKNITRLEITMGYIVS
eukprot:SAG31_NODE_16258_length_716_cov_1.418152_1_plen_34_part_01